MDIKSTVKNIADGSKKAAGKAGKNAKNIAMVNGITKVVSARGRAILRTLDNNSKNAIEISEKLLFKLLEESKDTEYGKLYDFANIHTIEDYKSKVPFSTYDDYEPYIKRMVENGEKNLITAREPKHFALSSGSVGVPKHIPVSQEELDIYSKYGTNMALGVADEYYHNTTGKAAPVGKGLNAIELKMMETPTGVPKGAISATLMKPLKGIIPYFSSSPWCVVCPEGDMDMKYLKARMALQDRNIAFMDAAFMTALVDIMDYIKENYAMLCEDIYHGRINEDVNVPEKTREELAEYIKPNPKRSEELMREFEKGFDTPIIPRIWPKLAWIGGIGTGGFFTYAKKMRKYAGKNIPFNNLCYAASESFVAVARHFGDESYVLVPEGGFYEFIPMKEGQDETEETLTIDQLEVGEDYEIVVTNLSGFYRYRIKDVVRVTGFYNESPLIQFIYRKSQMLSIQGEKTNEEAVRWTIEQFIKETGLVINDYSVYANTDSEPGHYTFLLEPDHILSKDEIPALRDLLDAKMGQANPSYGDKVRTGVLAPMELVIVQQQTYQLYRDMMIMKGTSPNQLKPVRIIDTPMKERFFFGLKEDDFE